MLKEKTHLVKNAIIMAAGFGSRLMPITENTPKPLINVNGKIMIETIIEALMSHNINEINIVVGYKKEKFDYLKEKYPNINLIENVHYNVYNNISSLYAAREHLGDTIILDGDQIIFDEEILNPRFSKSGYCCSWSEGETNEWLITINDNNEVINCSRNGGAHGWQLYSVSFWIKEDGAKLKACVEDAFADEEKRNLYWDDLAMFLYKEDFDLGIRQIKKGQVIEIDNLWELAELDERYREIYEAQKD